MRMQKGPGNPSERISCEASAFYNGPPLIVKEGFPEVWRGVRICHRAMFNSSRRMCRFHGSLPIGTIMCYAGTICSGRIGLRGGASWAISCTPDEVL